MSPSVNGFHVEGRRQGTRRDTASNCALRLPCRIGDFVALRGRGRTVSRKGVCRYPQLWGKGFSRLDVRLLFTAALPMLRMEWDGVDWSWRRVEASWRRVEGLLG